MLTNLIIYHFMSYSPYTPNLVSLSHPHGLEEAPVVHWPDPGHHTDVDWPNNLPFNVLLSPYRPNLGSLSYPHGLEEAPVVHRPSPGHHIDVDWPHNLSFHVLFKYCPYTPNFGSLSHSHGPDEAPVVHQTGPGHHVDVDWPHSLVSNVLSSPHIQFGLFISSPWPRGGTCGPLTWPWPPCRCWLTS